MASRKNAGSVAGQTPEALVDRERLLRAVARLLRVAAAYGHPNPEWQRNDPTGSADAASMRLLRQFVQLAEELDTSDRARSTQRGLFLLQVVDCYVAVRNDPVWDDPALQREALTPIVQECPLINPNDAASAVEQLIVTRSELADAASGDPNAGTGWTNGPQVVACRKVHAVLGRGASPRNLFNDLKQSFAKLDRHGLYGLANAYGLTTEAFGGAASDKEILDFVSEALGVDVD